MPGHKNTKQREDTGMNVCLMNDSFPPLIDGVANTVQNYANILTDDGDKVVVAVPDYPGATDDYSYRVIRYPSLPTTKLVGYRAGYPFSASTLDELEKGSFDLIHSHCPFVSTVVARTLRERIDVPLIFTYHTKFDIEIRRLVKSEILQEKAIKTLVKNIAACDEVWAVSRGAAENLSSMGYKGDIIVMENGVDFPKGAAGKALVDELAKRHGIDAGKPIYLFVGRLRWYKGIREILDGLSLLTKDGKDFTMLFIGDGEDKEDMQEYAGKAGVSEKCKFIGSVYDREELRGYYSLADLFLFPSSYDTFGLVVREAAACGTASMLVRGSCAAESASEDVDSFFIEESGESIYRKLSQVGFDKQRLKQAGENAQRNLYISWEESVARAKERYQIVLDKYKYGHTNRQFEWSDEFFNAMDEICDKVTRVRNQKDKLKSKGKEFRDSFFDA